MRSNSNVQVGQRGFLPIAFALTVLLLVPMWSGCSEDAVAPQNTNISEDESVFDVEMNLSSSTFEVANTDTEDPGSIGPRRFLIRGENIRYDEDLGALLVDMTLINASERTYPEPAILTFLALAPEGVTVLDSDNGETGRGAQFEFQFANDDAMWTPGEESLPRTIAFAVDQGVSVAFVARVQVGVPLGSGNIGGRVWHDANRNGHMDQGEHGVGGVEIRLIADGMEPQRTKTQPNGLYHFRGLASGIYTVTKVLRPGFEPTTPPTLQVVLVEDADGNVADFLAANFGCRRGDSVPPVIGLGDWIQAAGKYQTEPDRVVAAEIHVDKLDRSDLVDTWQTRRHAWLAGPVTRIDRETRRLAIMGTVVFFPEDDDGEDQGDDGNGDGTGDTRPKQTDDDPNRDDVPEEPVDFDDVEVGDRVQIVVELALTDAAGNQLVLIARRMTSWDARPDLVVGPVQMIEPRTSVGAPAALKAVNTLVQITEDTVIKFRD